jgi:uncharacterized protein YukE
VAYQNELESWWSGLPGPVHSALDWLYQPVDEALHWVAGDPDDLVRAGAVYLTVGPQIKALGSSVTNEANAVKGHWEGDDYTGFCQKIQQLTKALEALGDSSTNTNEILTAAAEAAVEGANAIIEIIKMVIAFALSSLVVQLALSVISFGASMVAWVAEQVAAGVAALARILSMVEKIAAFLTRVEQILVKIQQIFTKIKEIFTMLADLLKVLRGLSKGKDIFGNSVGLGERLAWMGVHGGVNFAGSYPLNQIPGVQVPGLVGAGVEGGKDVAGAVEHSNEAVDAAKE